MRIKRVEIIKYRNFENVVIDFENSKFPDVFSIASKNGGGKSTLLQFIFIMLHCFRRENRKSYILNLLDSFNNIREDTEVAKFIIEDYGQNYYLNFNFMNLSKEKIISATSKNNIIRGIKSFILIFETDLSNTQLEVLSNSIYLTVPNAQPLHFLLEDDRSELKQLLPNFSTYDFPTEKDILQSFDNAKEEDFEEMRLNNKYGTNYIRFKESLKDFIDGKEIGESRDGKRIVFKVQDENKELLLENLSHGEMRKLGIYIWLKNRVKKDSIILMDEIDIALHPSWQYELVDELVKWSKGSQFILATHSPQILSATYYKNLIILKNGEVKQLNQAPLDRDINIMLTSIMGSDYLPKELKELHDKYRNLFESGQIDTEEAKELKLEILEYESENSSFFQGIVFDRELQDI